MKLSINQSRCIGAGQCVLKAPMVFDQQEEDGLVILLQEHPGPEYEAAARVAARLCPASVIEVHD